MKIQVTDFTLKSKHKYAAVESANSCHNCYPHLEFGVFGKQAWGQIMT